MSTKHITGHAEKRMNQRGFKRSDPDLIRQCGTQVHDKEAESYVLLSKDVDREIRQMRKQIQYLERLRNTQAVFVGDDLVTIYHLDKRGQKSVQKRVR